ncbi:MAG: DUF6519 domain-containing protein [Candidatus Korobacteraceae bacterium]
MKADLTRNTFRQSKHFSRVLMQQGRVQLDADWNEQNSILLQTIRTLAADLIGPHGGPANDLGFSVTTPNLPALSPPVLDFGISSGHYYVDGILCANDPTPVAITSTSTSTSGASQLQVEVWTVDGVSFAPGQIVEVFDALTPAASTPAHITQATESTRLLTLDADVSSLGKMSMPRIRRLMTYTTQPDYPVKDKLAAGVFQVYLDVWERLITYVEDDAIREVALGGPDTAARSKVVAQVKVLPLPTTPAVACQTVDELNAALQSFNRGLLKARTIPSAASTDPCIISPTSQYRGPENQLYRVEVHTGGTVATAGATTPTFKWSRENGSVVFPIMSGGGTNTVTLESLGRDDRFGLAPGDWVEMLDDNYVLLNRAGTLLQVQSVDPTSTQVMLTGTPDSSVGQDPTKHPLLRRWDQKQGDEDDGGVTLSSDNAALIVEGSGENNWLNLEDGVQIQFQQSDANLPATYRTGDYWLIPARTATGDVEWPTETATDSTGKAIQTAAALPPEGIVHHYAPLAIIDVETNEVNVQSACGLRFSPSAAPET